MAELQLDPKKTALVLIDLQNAIVGMNSVPRQRSSKTPKNLPKFFAHMALLSSTCASISTTS
jgi:nicotinamidase-related amidase